MEVLVCDSAELSDVCALTGRCGEVTGVLHAATSSTYADGYNRKRRRMRRTSTVVIEARYLSFSRYRHAFSR